MQKISYLLISTMIVFIGCHSPKHDHAEHDHASIAVTQWTEKMEVFMEYETAVIGHEIKFIIHLTTMGDFQPIRDGKVILTFLQCSGSAVNLEKDALLREGIFAPIHAFDTPGDYKFTLKYDGPTISETFDIGTFTVYPSHESLPSEHEEHAHEEISFLKEQQWKMDFATEVATIRLIKNAVHAVGEVKPRPASSAIIVSPVEGIIGFANQLIKPGQKVNKGQNLAVLLPPLTTQNSWIEIFQNYERAKTEYNRAKRLQKRNAISAREMEQARRSYNLQKASFASYFGSDDGMIRFDSTMQQFQVTAPIKGIVDKVKIKPGQKVDYGQTLFSIVNPEAVWLQIELYAGQMAKLREISGLSIHIPGASDPLILQSADFNIISRGEIIDPVRRTVSLWLEVKNPDKDLLIGQTFNAQIYTSPSGNMLTFPRSALYEDDGKNIAFVHTSGESFEKRELIVGPEYNDYVAILSGVKSGERVVSRGGYQVKLASSSEAIGHPHTH